MHIICPSIPIPASTDLTEFLYISCRKKVTAPPFALPSAGARGHLPFFAPVLAATDYRVSE